MHPGVKQLSPCSTVLVSLNLRHLANEWAERNIGAVNLREGYQLISIRMPEEVLRYES